MNANLTRTILEKKKEESQDNTSLSQKVKELEEEMKNFLSSYWDNHLGKSE